MKKTYFLTTVSGALNNKRYDSYESAETEAKKFVKSYGDVTIYEAVAVAKQPVPDVEVVKVS